MPDFFVHPSAVIDEGCQIGSGTLIWHFSPYLVIAQNCNIGQRFGMPE
jgi:UDP-2-acetamido-3-amino-2,3-dideoxy-glucuronate N-acetyltransferase